MDVASSEEKEERGYRLEKICFPRRRRVGGGKSPFSLRISSVVELLSKIVILISILLLVCEALGA
jgi:hypothetical protein